MALTDPSSFAAVFVTLYAAHQVADHWVQTDTQAGAKGLPGRAGRRACAAHVATYTISALLALGLLHAVCGFTTPVWRLAAGLAVSAISHYIADRRTPLRRLADAVGSGRFWRLADHGINGAYLLDQSWHIFWLFITALIIG